MYKTFGDNIPQEVQNLIKAKFKKGLHKPIKIALVACEDIDLYKLKRRPEMLKEKLRALVYPALLIALIVLPSLIPIQSQTTINQNLKRVQGRVKRIKCKKKHLEISAF